ncbi:MAG: decaprenyl-phosphate phosphoribosyltransferase [Candidatus Peribacteraceae bacterium]|nr:decaprenyl-phosphate phosphoribosyltransferase [Candidatus Peribacteraceae bacterium]
MLLAILEELRPKQWIKNLLIFVPLVFANEFLNLGLLGNVAATFAAFCLASSSVYVLNDIVDRESDRKHPQKKSRPIASGKLPVGLAVLIALLFFLGSALIAWSLSPQVLNVLVMFVLLQIGYSLFLKHFVIVDLLAIALGFILRIVAGGAAASVELSGWLLAITFLLALLLASGKRLREIETAGKVSRKVLENYPPEFLQSTIKILLPAILISYLFYSFQATAAPRFFWTVPIVTFGLLRYLLLIERKSAHENPTDLLFEDRPLLVSVTLWALSVIAILYFA